MSDKELFWTCKYSDIKIIVTKFNHKDVGVFSDGYNEYLCNKNNCKISNTFKECNNCKYYKLEE